MNNVVVLGRGTGIDLTRSLLLSGTSSGRESGVEEGVGDLMEGSFSVDMLMIGSFLQFDVWRVVVVVVLALAWRWRVQRGVASLLILIRQNVRC